MADTALAAKYAGNPVTSIADDELLAVFDPDNVTLADRERGITYANFKTLLNALYQPLDSDLTTYAANGLAAGELQQLQNIDATTISATQWAALGGAGAYAGTLLSPADEAAFKAAVNLEIGVDVQAHNADLDAISAAAVTAAGITFLEIADAGADRIVAWDDSAAAGVGAFAAIASADITTEASPASGDFLLAYRAEGDFVKIDWASLPGVGSVNTSGAPVATDFARFTDADTIEGRSPAETRSDLGLVIGADVQAWDADLDALATAFTPADATTAAALALAEDTDNGVNTVSIQAPASVATDKIQTLQDVAGTIYVSGGTDIPVADGGTGASTAAAARANLGSEIGVDVQGFSANLDTYAGIAPSANVQSVLGAADFAAIRALLDLEAGTDFYSIAAADAAFEAADADILKADVGDVLTAGYVSDSFSGGTISTGTYTPAPATGEENHQHIVNGGAFTLAPPAAPCTVVLQIINNASAGAITTSGFTAVDGDAFTVTDGDDFMCFIAKTNDFSYLSVKALQ